MNLKNQADMHQSANALRAAIYGAPLGPNASVDRSGPGGELNGGNRFGPGKAQGGDE
jgi:hypothetical protein